MSDSPLHDHERELADRDRRISRLEQAVILARYELLEARKLIIAADDHLRRATTDG